MNHAAQPKRPLSDDPRFAQTVQSYEAGLRALQERKFEKAKGLFQKVVASGSRELADRAGVHLSTCNQHLDRTANTSFKTVEEHFDYSISLMNLGDYIAAREHLEKLVKQAPQADYVHYGLAALACLTASGLRTAPWRSAITTQPAPLAARSTRWICHPATSI